MMSFLPHTLRRFVPGDRSWRRGDTEAEPVTIVLPAGAFWAGAPKRGTVLRCIRGALWITQTNDPRDILLSPGEAFFCVRGGKIVVSSLRPATLQIQAASNESRAAR